MFRAGGQRREEALPVLVEQAQHPLGNFGRQRLVGLVVLRAPMHFVVVEIDARVDERLAHDIVSGIVEVLGGEGCRIDGRKAWIGLLDNMTLNQLHRPLPPSPSPPTRVRSPRFCAWPVVDHRAARRTSKPWPSDRLANPRSRSRLGSPPQSRAPGS